MLCETIYIHSKAYKCPRPLSKGCLPPLNIKGPFQVFITLHVYRSAH